jgi:hypothetical protein
MPCCFHYPNFDSQFHNPMVRKFLIFKRIFFNINIVLKNVKSLVDLKMGGESIYETKISNVYF